MTEGPLRFSVTQSSSPKSEEELNAILENPGFGRYFSDHMVRIDWNIETGWDSARVQPYGPLSIDPASAVLHYGQEVFEGIKAYRHEDDSIWTFRPEANAQRLQASARRLALPELPVEDFLESLRQLIAVDGRWVPSGGETSLYLRPFMIANEVFLGVRAAHNVTYMLIASPAGPYFAQGLKPVSIWLNEDYVRASKGGTGEAKCGGNYAASLLPQEEAIANGCSQVLFLDGSEKQLIEELGGMNIFFVLKDGSMMTPKLSGSILRGITRDSIIQLAHDRGISVDEREISIHDWREGVANGEITEVFACGTAAVITPLSELKSKDFTIPMPAGNEQSLTLALRQELTDIQYGRIPDRHNWLVRLDNN